MAIITNNILITVNEINKNECLWVFFYVFLQYSKQDVYF